MPGHAAAPLDSPGGGFEVGFGTGGQAMATGANPAGGAEAAPPRGAVAPQRGGGDGGERLSVGVLVDLYHSDRAGGHVKCWERLAEAAAGQPLDLTVYYLGRRAEVVPLAENSRYALVPPVLGSDRFRFLDRVVDHTDLAPFNPRLLGALRRHHVLHTTDAFFSMARTARWLARADRVPLVHSIHTDTPGYTAIHAEHVLRRLLGPGAAGRTLVDRWRLPQRLAERMRRKLGKHLARCDWVLAAEAEPPGINGRLAGRVSVLRRGVDRRIFHPGRRDRARLEARLGIAPDEPVLLFAGRLDPVKSVLTAARAARLLRDRGVRFQFVFAGRGEQAEEIRGILGERAHLLGQVSQDELAWLYASADLFVFPSETEVWPNALVEALASGLPAAVSSAGGSAERLRAFSAGGAPAGLVVAGQDPAAWAAVIETWLVTPGLREATAQAARQAGAARCPSWREVLAEDLLPVWRRVAAERGLATAAHGADGAGR